MARLLEECKNQPDLFNELFLNRPAYWSRQKDLCRSVVDYRTTVAYSGNTSGQHAGHLPAVVEEAPGVEDFVFDAIDSLGYERLVCIGNPIRAEGKFVDLIRQADRDRADNIPPRLAVNAIRISTLMWMRQVVDLGRIATRQRRHVLFHNTHQELTENERRTAILGRILVSV